MSMLSQILNIMYTGAGKEGGTYGVSIWQSDQISKRESGSGKSISSTDPVKRQNDLISFE